MLTANDGISHVSRLVGYWSRGCWEQPITCNAVFGEYLFSSDFGKRYLGSLMCRADIDCQNHVFALRAPSDSIEMILHTGNRVGKAEEGMNIWVLKLFCI